MIEAKEITKWLIKCKCKVLNRKGLFIIADFCPERKQSSKQNHYFHGPEKIMHQCNLFKGVGKWGGFCHEHNRNRLNSPYKFKWETSSQYRLL